jgi:hypothetical protein
MINFGYIGYFGFYAKNPWAGLGHPKPSWVYPWAGLKSENPTQPAFWRGLTRTAVMSRDMMVHSQPHNRGIRVITIDSKVERRFLQRPVSLEKKNTSLAVAI